MRKKLRICVGIISAFTFVLSSVILYGFLFIPDSLRTSAAAETSERRYVAVGGELIGIRLFTEGIIVVGTETFESESGVVSPAESAGLRKGDILLEADGKKLGSNTELTEIIRDSGGSEVKILFERDGKRFSASLFPQRAESTAMYKGGLWIRDSVGGIGTLTYCDAEHGTVAALGHGIYDSDTGGLLPASDGSIVSAKVLNIEKGCSGKAGQLCGAFMNHDYGTLNENNSKGIYGKLTALYSTDNILPVAHAKEVHPGKAQIVCTVTDGQKQFYDIEIEKLLNSSSDEKNMIIKITDTSLLSMTGGIIQGMSGSPILQDGMLAGAVTHVFINDPTKGYGIFAEAMLRESDTMSRIPLAPAA